MDYWATNFLICLLGVGVSRSPSLTNASYDSGFLHLQDRVALGASRSLLDGNDHDIVNGGSMPSPSLSDARRITNASHYGDLAALWDVK
jgi:hypothetical protein